MIGCVVNLRSFFSCPPSKLFHTLAILNQVHCRGLPPTSRIAVREIACVWPMLDSISHAMRVAGWGWRQESGTFPALEEPLFGATWPGELGDDP
jgi:hypothetical protein